MAKSSLELRSNVYVNRTKLPRDPDFAKRVRGIEALKSLQQQLGANFAGLLTQDQRKEVEGGSSKCYLDEDHSYGYIRDNRELRLVNRCERQNCQHYPGCSQDANFRFLDRAVDKVVVASEKKHSIMDFSILEYYGEISISAFDLNKLELDKTNTAKKQIEQIELELVEDLVTHAQIVQTTIDELKPEKTQTFMYNLIPDPKPLVVSPLMEQILVNAGPGTGKTYTVIERMSYLIENEMVDPSSLLVLCFSRSAVAVIKERLENKIQKKQLPLETRLIYPNIRTLDSFATLMLRDSIENLAGLTYDERIVRFILELEREPEVFSELGYLIVDEIQDIIGVRARMLKAILERLNCGFMLLGDKCQSIYDYQIDSRSDELSSARFYTWLEKESDLDLKGYELEKNRRQEPSLAMFSKYLRETILANDVDGGNLLLQEYVEILDRISVDDLWKKFSLAPNQTWAVLCRNNALVAEISKKLSFRDIPHKVFLGAQHMVLEPWIAEVLSTYTERHLGKRVFIEEALGHGLSNPENKWKLLKEVEGLEAQNVLDLNSLKENFLIKRNIPNELDLALRENQIIVSTIHRAKGKEFDNVIWVHEINRYREDDTELNLSDIDEFKVAYVSVSRPRKNLMTAEHYKMYIRSLSSSRLIQTGRSKKSGARLYCSAILLGRDGDMDPASFVKGTAGEALINQNYIRDNILPGDPVSIELFDDVYKVFHNGRKIGHLAHSMRSELRDAMNKTNKSPNLPLRLTDAYVRDVHTIVHRGYNEEVPSPYAESGIWLGVEIAGMARTAWK